MMHGSWDIKAQGIEFLAIWGHFLPFDPLTTPKIKFLKKWKTLLEISSFYTSVHHKWQSYDVWFLKYEACRQNLSFSLFLPFYCSNSPKNQNKKKKKQPAGIILHISIKKYDLMFLRYGVWWTDRQKDRKIDIQRWVPHLKTYMGCWMS